jgi:cell division GTPase FtsZ
MIEFDEESGYATRIKVVGVGGAGNTVVDKMADLGGDVDLIAINTDIRALKQIRLRKKIRIGKRRLSKRKKEFQVFFRVPTLFLS